MARIPREGRHLPPAAAGGEDRERRMSLTVTVLAAALLLVLSGSLSGSETAFFSLGEVERRRLAEERGWPGRASVALLARRRNLLMTLLLANLLVNLLFFSLSSELSSLSLAVS